MKNKVNLQNITKNIQEFCSKYLIYVVAVIILILGICSFFVTAYFDATFEAQVEKTSYKPDLILLNLILIPISLLIVLGLCKLIKNVKVKNVLIGIILIIFVAQTLWVLHLKYQSGADQKCIINSAECMKNEDYGTLFENNGYLNKYPFLIGIVLYIEIVYNLLSTNNELMLQFLNVIYSVINIILMYKITEIIFKNKYIQKISIVLLTGFSIYFLFFNPHVYGNIIGMLFGLIAVLYTLKYLKRRKIRDILIIAISITLSIILKSNYNIFLCAIIITLGLEWLKSIKIKTIIGIASILLIYMISQQCLNIYTQKRTGYNPKNMGVPMITYVYMGMAEPQSLSSGWYTGDTLKLYEDNNFDKEKINNKTLELIKNRIREFAKEPKKALEFYKDKLASTWLNPTYQTVWCSIPGEKMDWYPNYREYLNHKKIVLSMLSGKIYKLEEIYFNTYQIIIFTTAFIGMICIQRKDKLKYMLLPLIFLGGFLFHTFWETKSIYVLQYFYLLIPYSSFGLYCLYKKSRRLLKRREEIKK